MQTLAFRLLVFTLVADCCFAQDRCVALLQHGLYNTYRTTSGNSNLSQAQSQFCSDYSSYKQSGVSGNLSVSYGLFSGSAGASQSQIESVGQAVCTASFTYQTAQAMLNNFASIIDPSATDAFNKCVDAAKQGLIYDLNASPIDPNTLSISIYYQQKGNTTPQHVDGITISQSANLQAAQRVTCDGPLFAGANKQGGVTLNQNVLGMTCVRSGSPQGFTYMAQQVYAAPARITVNTNVGQITADLPLIPVAKPTPPATLVPIGTVIAFGGDGEPGGWMKCDGRPVSRTEYPELFSAIGTAHGSGNGVSTFNLPDYRGRFLRGVSTDSDGRDPDRNDRTAAQNGGNTGAKVGSIEPDAVGQHRHWVANSAAMTGVTGSLEYTSNGGFPPTHFTDDRDGVDKNPTLKKETRPINAAVVFLIKVR